MGKLFRAGFEAVKNLTITVDMIQEILNANVEQKQREQTVAEIEAALNYFKDLKELFSDAPSETTKIQRNNKELVYLSLKVWNFNGPNGAKTHVDELSNTNDNKSLDEILKFLRSKMAKVKDEKTNVQLKQTIEQL